MSRWYVRYGIPAVILALLLWRTQMWRADEVLRDVRWWPVVVALLLNLLYPLPLALRLRIVLQRMGRQISARSLVPVALFGNMASSLTPVASGEALRPFIFRDQLGMPLHEGGAVVFYERAYSFYLTALTALAALAVVFLPGPVLGPLAGALVLLLFFLPAWLYEPFAGLVLWVLGRPALAALTGRPSINHLIEELTKGSDLVVELFHDFPLAVKVTAASYVVFLMMTAQFWLVLLAFHQELALYEVWALISASFMVGVASAVPLGLGTADGTMVFFLTRFDVSGVSGTAIALLYRVVATLPAGIMGLWGFWQAGRGREAGLDGQETETRPEGAMVEPGG